MPLPRGRARAFEAAGKQGCACVAWSRKRRSVFISRQGVYESPRPSSYAPTCGQNGTVDNTEAVFKAYEIVKEIGLNIQLPPDGNNDYPYPTGQKRSDHAPFNDIGIPYIYFEANNWENGSPVETEKNGLIMHTDMDDLDFIENEYSGRVQNTLSSYSTLLYSLLQENNWEQ